MLDILERARKTNARDWVILVLAFHHGLRVTEVLELNIEGSINWKDRTLTVKRLKGSLTTTQPLVEIRGKPALSEVAALKAYLRSIGPELNLDRGVSQETSPARV